MRKILQHLPGAKTIAITIAVCLLLGVLIAGGLHLKALLGLAFALAFLVVLTARNYNPNSYQAATNPVAYMYRTQRDELLESLRTLTEAVETDRSITVAHAAATRAADARRLIDKLDNLNRAR